MALDFPDSPGIGSIFRAPSGFNYEWDGTVWKSYTDASTANIKILDDIGASFDGIETIFSLAVGGTAFTPTNSQQLRVVLGGVVQEPITDYYVSGNQIVFTTAPANGLTVSIISLGPAVPITTPDLGNVYNRQTYTPTGSQTTFSITYTVGYLDVYHNGVKLIPGTDFTATNGTSFDLTVAAQNGDVVEAIAYNKQNLYSIVGSPLTELTVTGISSLSGDINISDSISHIGDTDTKIRFPGLDTFTVETTGSERLRVASDGNVGINSTSPGLSLDVLGGLRFAGEALENINITAGKLSDNQDIDLANGMVHYFTISETTVSTPNIRIDGSTSLDSRMDVGNTAAITIIITPNGSGYSNALNIDSSAQTVQWLGGSAPSSGGLSGVDVYTYQIIKTGSATFTVLGSLSNFA